MKVIELAQEAHRLIDSDSSISVSSISYFLREQIGVMNNLLGLDLSIDTNAQITPNLTEAQKAIYKQLYVLHFYSFKVRENLGASAVSPVTRIDDFGTSVTFQNKNELAKTWLALKKQAQEDLDKQIKDYNKNQFSPVQTVGDDYIYSLNGGLSNSQTSDSVY